MKSVILLATAIFLASAPAPDSRTLSEVSGGFLTTTNFDPLMAAEPVSPVADDRNKSSVFIATRPDQISSLAEEKARLAE